MNKILAKVTALCVGLAMVAGVGVAVGSKKASSVGNVYAAATKEKTFDLSSSVPSDLTASVTLSADATRGMGKGGADFTLTTTSSYSNVTKVVVNAATNYNSYSGHSISVTVGGSALGSTQSFSAKASTDYTFEGSKSTGVVVVSFDNCADGTTKSNTIWCKTIEVWTDGGTPVVSYTVTYDANGGTGTMSDSANTVAECTFTAPTGKVFSTWNTAANGSGIDYAPGATVTADTDLYAIWVDAPNSVSLTASTTGDFVAPWSVDNTPNQVESTGSARGWQWSSGTSAVITYANAESVEKVVVSSTTNGSGTLAVTVGGNAFDDSTAISSTKTTYTFEGDDSGDVVITLTNGVSNKSVYIDYIEIFFKSVDPTLDTLVILLNDATPSPATVSYSGGGLYYANDKDGNDINAEWSSSNTSIFTVGKNGNNVCYVTPVAPGTATITAHADGFNDGVFVLTIDAGAVETVTVSGAMTKTSYYVGDAWSPAGLTVTADYEYGYHGDVTSSASWTYNPASPATSVTSVVATATFGEKSGSSSAQTVTVSRVNPIKALYSKSSGDTISATGYFVGYSPADGAYIMDGEYGFLIGDRNLDCSDYVVNETVLHAEGKLYLSHGQYKFDYSGLTVTEVTDPETIAQIEKPVVYNAKGGETVEYESRLTTVSGVVQSVTPNGVAAEDYAWDKSKDVTIVVRVGETPLNVFFKKLCQTTTLGEKIMAALSSGDEITIKGFVAWYDAFQVSMIDIIESSESYGAEEFAQQLMDATDAVCAGWKEGDNNHDALVGVWSDLVDPNAAEQHSFPYLSAADKLALKQADADEDSENVVERAMARYDYLVGRYNLDNFIERSIVYTSSEALLNYQANLDSSSSITIIVIVAVTSMTLLGVTLVLRKRKMN